MVGPEPFHVGLTAAEDAIDGLAARLDVALEGLSGHCAVVLGIARQASEVYRGLRREAEADPLGVTAPILLRSLVDAAILVRWIEDDRRLRVEMYMAEADRHRLAAAEPFGRFRKARGTSTGPVYPAAEVAEMQATVRDVRSRARAASEPIRASGTVLPTTEAMAVSTGDTAMWEAYQIIFRITSPWTHLGGWSLASHRIEARADGQHLVVEGGHKGVALRALAAPSMAHMIGSASRICGLGLEGETRIWQDAVVTWPAPIVESIRPGGPPSP